jgi:methylglutaconyl-CoA hydratase
MNEAVRYERAGAVATLTMDQPHNRNALTSALLDGLGEGLARALGDEGVRVVVLSHTGPAFCAGADLKATGAEPPPRNELADLFTAIQRSPKPVLARIAGHCFGGGVGLAAACDISVASQSARFAFSEVRLGVAPAIISVVCLPKLTRGAALELFLTGAPLGAARAAEAGLITRAVVDADLDGVVGDLVGQLLLGAPSALAVAKRLVYDVPTMPQEAALAWTAELSRDLFSGEEAQEGKAAFAEHRAPGWAESPGGMGGD